jgi:hypothetical protein
MAATPAPVAGTAERLAAPPALPKQKGLEADVSRQRYLKRLARLKTERGPVLSEMRDITDFIRPRRGIYFEENPNARNRRNSKIVNSTPTIASRTLGSGMTSGVSSPARPWFGLDLPNPAIKERANVKQWLFASTSIIRLILAKSNFYDQIQVFYRDLGDFGNACMITDEDYDNVITCQTLPPGTYYWAIGKSGKIDTLYYEYRSTVQQLVQDYGIENVSRSVKDKYNKNALDDLVWCVFVIEPNMQQEPDLRGPRGMPFVAVWLERDGIRDEDEKNKVLRRRGYRDWPVSAARWDVQSGEVYGSGPGLDALGDAKALQVLERRKAQAIDKLVTPPLQSPSQPGVKVSNLPGEVTFIGAQAGQAAIVRPLYEQNGQGIQAISAEIQRHEERINRAYYADLFLMLAQSTRREITAREVEERHEEKLLALGPVLERLHSEALNVAIERAFMIAFRADLIPPPPDEIQGMDLRIEYTSILAQAQKAVAVGGIERLFGFVGNLAAGDPTVTDKVDFEQAIDEYADALSVPPSLVRSDDDVAKRRKARDEQAAQMQQAQMGTLAAQNAKVLSETKMGDGNALEQVLGLPS